MGNRWISALIKTIITLVIVHIILLIVGWLWGNQIGWFDWTYVWAHWHTFTEICIAVVALLGLYFGIYAFCTKDTDQIDMKK